MEAGKGHERGGACVIVPHGPLNERLINVRKRISLVSYGRDANDILHFKGERQSRTTHERFKSRNI